jgi:uncharacterized RDD family membrane protein YckC
MTDPGRDERNLLQRVTGGVTGRVVNALDPDAVLAQIDVDAVLDRIDPNALLDRIDANALLDRVDMDALLARVDLETLMARIDPNALLVRVEPAVLLDRIEPDDLLAKVDMNALLGRVDIDALVARLDPDALLARVDPDVLLARIDLDALLGRVDLDATLARVDVEALVARSGVPDLITDSTQHLFGTALDLARRQLVALDVVIDRTLARLLRRDPDRLPVGPARLLGLPAPTRPGRSSRTTVTGHYTGPVTRAVAAGLDAAFVLSSFTVGVAGLNFLLQFIVGASSIDVEHRGPLAIGALALWAWTYSFATHAVAGRTLAKGLVGIRVVAADGRPLTVRQAFVRTLAFPLSALLLGAGFLLALVQREHRALHDLIGGTAEVYDWGERPAELPGPLSAFLARQDGAAV